MLSKIQNVINDWKLEDSPQKEQKVREALIFQILLHLGWSKSEINTNYPIKKGSVPDYVLLVEEKLKAIIEAKGEDIKLGEAQREQLKNYVFELGKSEPVVRLAVLTNGKEWEFYFPEIDSFDTRRLESVAINEPLLPHLMISVLSRCNVITEKAVQNAETLLRGKTILPQLMQFVRNFNDGDEDSLIPYLQNLQTLLQNQAPAPPDPPVNADDDEPAPGDAELPNVACDGKPNDDVTGRKPHSFTFDEVTYTVNKWSDILTKLCEILCDDRNPRDFDERVLNIAGPLGGRRFVRNENSGEIQFNGMNANNRRDALYQLICEFGHSCSELSYSLAE